MADTSTHSSIVGAGRRRGVRQTVCGVFVPLARLSPTPTCPACAAFASGTEDDADRLFGTPDPATPMPRTPEVDPVAEYHVAYRRAVSRRR